MSFLLFIFSLYSALLSALPFRRSIAASAGPPPSPLPFRSNGSIPLALCTAWITLGLEFGPSSSSSLPEITFLTFTDGYRFVTFPIAAIYPGSAQLPQLAFIFSNFSVLVMNPYAALIPKLLSSPVVDVTRIVDFTAQLPFGTGRGLTGPSLRHVCLIANVPFGGSGAASTATTIYQLMSLQPDLDVAGILPLSVC